MQGDRQATIRTAGLHHPSKMGADISMSGSSRLISGSTCCCAKFYKHRVIKLSTIIQWADIGFVLNMDECLNDDDDEEHHRVFCDCFGALHERLSIHAGSGFLKRGDSPRTEPACRTAGSARYYLRSAPAGTYGGLTGQ